jgi:hypothetical protein
MLLLKYIGKKFYTRIQVILRNTLNTIAPFLLFYYLEIYHYIIY